MDASASAPGAPAEPANVAIPWRITKKSGPIADTIATVLENQCLHPRVLGYWC